MDQMQITILEDGTIKADTGYISSANHSTAEAFMRNLAQAAGAPQTRKHKAGFIGAAIHAAQHALMGGHGGSHGPADHTHTPPVWTPGAPTVKHTGRP